MDAIRGLAGELNQQVVPSSMECDALRHFADHHDAGLPPGVLRIAIHAFRHIGGQLALPMTHKYFNLYPAA